MNFFRNHCVQISNCCPYVQMFLQTKIKKKNLNHKTNDVTCGNMAEQVKKGNWQWYKK